MERLQRFRGHFYNWYDTRDLRPLEPAYVSSVDSGNLAGHLIALANACAAWRGALAACDQHRRRRWPTSSTLAREALQACPTTGARSCVTRSRAGRRSGRCSPRPCCGFRIDCDDPALRAGNGRRLGSRARQRTGRCRERGSAVLGRGRATVDREPSPRRRAGRRLEPQRWIAGCRRSRPRPREPWRSPWSSISCSTANARLLSIGYLVAEDALDPSCYDLLASEARLASFVAIAKGDVPARHWFRLGREVTPIGRGAALISWSGSMFEYLMPSLVMRAPLGSLLEQTNGLIVRRQIDYAAGLGVPWGISESAYNARDKELTYQYSNFGVPGLGFKRGLSENVVIAPYATALAAMVDPAAAAANFARLAGDRRARPLRLLRGARLHAGAPAGRQGRRGRARLHGPSPGHDARRHRQRAARRRDAHALPRRADDPGDRAPAAGAHAARRRRRPSAGRGGRRRRHGATISSQPSCAACTIRTPPARPCTCCPTAATR